MPDKSLQIPTADGQADAFAAFPGNGGRHPGVLLYPDAFGVRPVLRQMARDRLIDAHRRHRVAWTTPDEPTIWLAVHFGK